jgi:hypothetical protein
MAEIVISPSGPGAIDADLMIDEVGARFVVLTFREPDADPILITFPIPLFQAFTAHLRTVEKAALDEANWEVGE